MGAKKQKVRQEIRMQILTAIPAVAIFLISLIAAAPQCQGRGCHGGQGGRGGQGGNFGGNNGNNGGQGGNFGGGNSGNGQGGFNGGGNIPDREELPEGSHHHPAAARLPRPHRDVQGGEGSLASPALKGFLVIQDQLKSTGGADTWSTHTFSALPGFSLAKS